MEAKRLGDIKNSIEDIISYSFRFIGMFLNVFIISFFIFGSAAAIALLIKMFPDTASKLTVPMLLVFSIILKIILLVIIFLVIMYGLYILIIVIEYFVEYDKRMKNRRKLFADDLVKRLKKELKTK